ncbi:ribonuclease P protein component [Pseudoalteromonas sp. CST5]|uniref:ribonuclease P protein component n=1 Tax=unclassified Pseudoalteromonas TaxID=194690 RepID=UPI0023587F30|nr:MULTISPECIES: ribonuclease P protein component [unclassified Pseudoalteromonas]MDC9515136.1 ribonuclease P protein component [Pseudoalteromonas sp. CST1]MDC9539420.1 ribonuclease P protein component [Pseudoalteromonas sp. CST3]MDC9543419.1 ribonuclease P protein component [Pseudoalteromonas sp. CST2]MDC9546937.1 ribonuclease P protein component [Pseudoalteromonas sp. CST4]MDC9551118.1 ribonuclease P protein component [Pseudoalteromonas sp. CST5]
MEDFSFGRELRLLTPSHYSRIFNEPARAATPLFTLLAKPNDQDKPRLGLTVAKKRVKKACQRNRIKRLARESFRLNQNTIDNIDIVLMVKSGIDEQSNEEITKQLTKLWRKINERCKPGAPKPPPFKKRPNKSAKSNKQTR